MIARCGSGASISRNCRSLVLVSHGFKSKWHNVPRARPLPSRNWTPQLDTTGVLTWRARRAHACRVDPAGLRRGQQQVHGVGSQPIGMDHAASVRGHVAQLFQVADARDGLEEAGTAVIAALHDVSGDVGQAVQGPAGHATDECGDQRSTPGRPATGSQCLPVVGP